ncbi:MAG: hypothetical protein HY364_00205, partial [Candidatus Aenigmarchaeota archaeon]|nr:hypothetical protein [Candidatus Aenigmarchaeota archaeon]
GTAYGISHLTNRPNAGYNAPVVRTIEQPANAPTLVAEPGFQTPLVPTALPQTIAVPETYTPIRADYVQSKNIVLQWKTPVNDEIKNRSLSNVSRAYKTLEYLYGNTPDSTLIMDIDNGFVHIDAYPPHPLYSGYKYKMDLGKQMAEESEEAAYITDELSSWFFRQLISMREIEPMLALDEGASMYTSKYSLNPSDDFKFIIGTELEPMYRKLENSFAQGRNGFVEIKYEGRHARGAMAIAALEDAGFGVTKFREYWQALAEESKQTPLEVSDIVNTAERMTGRNLDILYKILE